jgi:hypothetical protein
VISHHHTAVLLHFSVSNRGLQLSAETLDDGHLGIARRAVVVP